MRNKKKTVTPRLDYREYKNQIRTPDTLQVNRFKPLPRWSINIGYVMYNPVNQIGIGEKMFSL